MFFVVAVVFWGLLGLGLGTFFGFFWTEVSRGVCFLGRRRGRATPHGEFCEPAAARALI